MKKDKYYPKILILGMNFSTTAGGGVTLSNLFYKWPKGRLYLANETIRTIDKNYVNDFFDMNVNDQLAHRISFNPLERLVNVIKSDLTKLHLLNDKIDYYSNNSRFFEWIKSINPDVIYFMTHKIQHIKLIQEINSKIDIPVAVHIVDDWLQSKKSKFFNKIIVNKLEFEFKKILSSKNLFLGISDDMRIEYKKRYKTDFYPIHNPITQKTKIPHKTIDKTNIKILYAGSIEKYNIEELLDLCKSIEYNKNIIFNIYGNFRNDKDKRRFENYSNCFLKGLVSHNTIIELMSAHDILFLPMSFEKRMKKITKLSMPTKFTEYINSGTITLLYAPENQSVTNYAESQKCAYIVSKKSHLLLKDALYTIIESNNVRESIIKNAMKLAINNHYIDIVQKQFISILMERENENNR